MDEAELVAGCRSGDEQAVEALVNQYRAPLFRLALSVLDNPADADEAVQDALVAALRGLKGYRGQAAFRTWLFTIVLNVCRGRLRQRRFRLKLAQTLQALWPRGSLARVEAVALEHERDTIIWQAVSALPDRHRLPVVLRYYHGYATAEIAEMLRVPKNTVISRLAAARKRLREQLGAAAVLDWTSE